MAFLRNGASQKENFSLFYYQNKLLFNVVGSSHDDKFKLFLAGLSLPANIVEKIMNSGPFMGAVFISEDGKNFHLLEKELAASTPDCKVAKIKINTNELLLTFQDDMAIISSPVFKDVKETFEKKRHVDLLNFFTQVREGKISFHLPVVEVAPQFSV